MATPNKTDPAIFNNLRQAGVPHNFIQGMADWSDRLNMLGSFQEMSHLPDGSVMKPKIELGKQASMSSNGSQYAEGQYNGATKTITISDAILPISPNNRLLANHQPLDTAGKIQALHAIKAINHEYRHHVTDPVLENAQRKYQAIVRDSHDDTVTNRAMLDYAHTKLDCELDAHYGDYKLLTEALAQAKKSDPALAAGIKTQLLDSHPLYKEIQAFEKQQGHPITQAEFHDNFRVTLLKDFGYAQAIAADIIPATPGQADGAAHWQDMLKNQMINQASQPKTPCPTPLLQGFKDQLDEQLKPKLLAAGCSEKIADAMIAVGVEKCAGIKGAENIAFAGVDKEHNRIVIQTDAKLGLVAYDAIAASKADPTQTLASAEQTLQQQQEQQQTQARQLQAPSHGGHSLV